MYCTIEDLQAALPNAELIRLTDDAGSGAIDTHTALVAIGAGAREIDAFLGNLPRPPIGREIPPFLNQINVDLAIYRLWARVATEIPAVWKDRRLEAVRRLEALADGRIALESVAPGSHPRSVRAATRPRSFGPRDMDKY